MVHAAVVAVAVTMAVDLIGGVTVENMGRGRVVTGFVDRSAQVTVDGQRRDEAEQQHAQQAPMVAL